jgi:hypothetical protein
MLEKLSRLDHLQLILVCQVDLCQAQTHLPRILRASQTRQHTIQAIRNSLRTIQATTVQATVQATTVQALAQVPTALRPTTVRVMRDNQPTVQATLSLQSTLLTPMVLTRTTQTVITATAATSRTMDLLSEPAVSVATHTFTTTTMAAAQDLVQDHRS